VEFDLSWNEGRLAYWVRRLPPAGDRLRRAALIEMVMIDQERRLQLGQRARLEAYLKALPELGPADRLPADLLLAEYDARQQCGAAVEVAEFGRRFPRQADELRRLLEQRRDEAGPATRHSSLETTRPAGDGTDAISTAPAPAVPLLPSAVPVLERLGRYRI